MVLKHIRFPEILTISLALFVGVILCLSSGPEDIKRKEGETYVIIPCPYPFGSSMPVWLINDLAYTVFNLPSPYVAYQNGLTILVISKELDGATFQCCITTIENEIAPILCSGVGTLTVEGGSSGKTPPIIFDRDTNIVLDFQSVLFNSVNRTLEWGLKDATLCHERHHFEVKGIIRNNCTSSIDENQNHTSDHNITLPNSWFSSENTTLLASIEAVDADGHVCSRLGPYLLIPENMTMGEMYVNPNQNVCLPVPYVNGSGGVEIVWPNITNHEDRELNPAYSNCICPLRCGLDFETCPCIHESSSVYNVEFINDTITCKHPNYTICWNNINPMLGMNDTRIYFINDYYPSCDYQNDDIIISEFIQAERILINGLLPNAPNVTVENETTLKICSNDSNSTFPVKEYMVNITDNTAEFSKFFKLTRNTNMNNCTLHPKAVDDLKPKFCSPFNVKVSARNDVGWSSLNETTINTNVTGDQCRCMQEKVLLQNITVTEKRETKIKIQITCSKTLALSNLTELSVKIQTSKPSSDGMPEPMTIQCDGSSQSLLFSDLKKTTTYNISVYWKLPSCQIHMIQEETMKGNTQWKKIFTISESITAALLLISVVVNLVLCCCRKQVANSCPKFGCEWGPREQKLKITEPAT